MRINQFECDSCGKRVEFGPDAAGWLVVGQVVMASAPREQELSRMFCSLECLRIGAAIMELPELQEPQEEVTEAPTHPLNRVLGHAPDGQYL